MTLLTRLSERIESDDQLLRKIDALFDRAELWKFDHGHKHQPTTIEQMPVISPYNRRCIHQSLSYQTPLAYDSVERRV
jgi:hypothetical protein